MHSPAYKHAFHLILAALLGLAVYHIMGPFWNTLAWAVVLGLLLHPLHTRLTRRVRGKSGLSAILLLAGCSSPPPLTLMPSPVIYESGSINSFTHLSRKDRSIRNRVFYVTNRRPASNGTETPYGNSLSSSIHLGEATVRMGAPHDTWRDLVASSLAPSRANPVSLEVENVRETARMPVGGSRAPLDAGQRHFAIAINRELNQAIDKEIMVYVHGTKVGFANSVVLTSEIDHFAGRDFVGVAFSWPSHQNILYYLSRVDVWRARHSSEALAETLAKPKNSPTTAPMTSSACKLSIKPGRLPTNPPPGAVAYENFQSLCCLNSDRIPTSGSPDSFDWRTFVKLTLRDGSPDGGLFGFRFGEGAGGPR